MNSKNSANSAQPNVHAELPILDYICSMRFPTFLKSGDKVGIVSPARKISPDEVAPALASLQEWGLVPVLGTHIYSVYHQYAGTDADRVADLQRMIDDPEIKAILCSRGGYGCLRIVDAIDFGALKKHPKWLIGFSDLTAFAMAAYRAGCATIHGPMAISWNGKTADVTARGQLRALLMGELPKYSYAPTAPERLRTGRATGRLIGGNLSILSQLIGTPDDFETKGCILFIEDIDEYLYHIDRMLVHLKRAGKLKNLAGLIVGGFSDLKDNDIPFGKTVEEIVLDAIGEADFPICFGFPTGHWPQNYPLVHGAMATLSVSHSAIELQMELR
jgi:muramoyltetrapeptide carboxypeptidase